jgi:hypothetical protein
MPAQLECQMIFLLGRVMGSQDEPLMAHRRHFSSTAHRWAYLPQKGLKRDRLQFLDS